MNALSCFYKTASGLRRVLPLLVEHFVQSLKSVTSCDACRQSDLIAAQAA